MKKIFFNNADVSYKLKDKNGIRLLIEHVFKKEKKLLDQLSIILCSDEYLLSLNQKFLSHDYFTDILTFEISNPGEPIVGELYISTDRIAENAQNLNVPARDEVLRVIIHGVLHLCGYKDNTKVLKRQIHKKEDFYLKAF